MVWCRYVTDKDLDFFKERVEQPGEVKGAGPWEHMMYKDFGSFTYEAWRRSLTVCLLFNFQAVSTMPMRWCFSALCLHASCVMQALGHVTAAGSSWLTNSVAASEWEDGVQECHCGRGLHCRGVHGLLLE